MNKKLSALILSCLFLNATMFPMIQDEEAPDERIVLSRRQKAVIAIPCGLGLSVSAMYAGLLYGVVVDNPGIGDHIGTSMISIVFVALGSFGSRTFLNSYKKKNKKEVNERIHARENAALELERGAIQTEREEAARYHREHPYIQIAENMKNLQRDLSEKDTLNFQEAADFENRWQGLQTNFSASKDRYTDDEMKAEHEAQLAEISNSINMKVGMGLQANVKSAANEG